ncbi:carbohydrate ABC transporter permease [Truepera radiovictrix]|nr:carbohydrate ABC transporter permease [Truepera radiovictrix]WMT58649.1 carbohydrate ABC transporter permease [Truepera radiovictrix]
MRAITAAFCLFVALPILWLVYAAFLPAEALVQANLATFGVSFDNFAALWGSGLWRALGVSVSATSLVVLGQLTFGLGAAYAIRNGFRLLGLVMVLLALPTELLIIPLYRQLQSLALLDTLAALILPFLASPLVIFLLLQALRRIPRETIEAARLDGAGELTIVGRIVAPMLRPELLATGVLAFASHWNLVLYPRVMTSESLWTVQAVLTELLRTRPFEWGLLGAAALVTSLPILLLYSLFEKRIVQVFEAGFRS